MAVKDLFKKLPCCGIGKKMCGVGEDGKKCCPCRCLVKLVFLFVILFIANTYLGFSNKAIDNYIQKNPRRIIESVENMVKNERGVKAQESKKKASEVVDKLKDHNYPFIGNRFGSKTIVEFFDYNCGYCKKQNQELNSLVSKDKNVKVVLVNLPIMSEASFFAAQASIATFNNVPAKFDTLHSKLLSSKLDNKASVMNVVESVLGKDADVVKKAMSGKGVEEQINKNYEYMKEIGIQGTPAFIIGKEFIPGYTTANEIEGILKK